MVADPSRRRAAAENPYRDRTGPGNPLDVLVLVPGTAHVVHDLVLAVLDDGVADAPPDVCERLLLAHARVGPLPRVEDAVGVLTWLMVAGPLARFLPRLPGWRGWPSNLRIPPLSLSTWESRPRAASQLKQTVGTIW